MTEREPTGEELRDILGMMWALKPSDFSTMLALLEEKGGGILGTTQGSCNCRFWDKLCTFGWAERREAPAGVGAAFAVTPLGRDMLPPGIKITMEGYPPERATFSREALGMLEDYAAEDNPQSLNKLGVLYQKGIGVEADHKRAAQFFARAAKAGDKQAHNNLGVLYIAGLGVEKNAATALDWFVKGAGLGSTGAMDNLGEMYAKGIGVTADVKESKKWFGMASAYGHALAQCKLAVLLLSEEPRDYPQAYIWSCVAMAGGYDASQLRDKAKKNMTDDQVAEADRTIATWQPLPEKGRVI